MWILSDWIFIQIPAACPEPACGGRVDLWSTEVQTHQSSLQYMLLFYKLLTIYSQYLISSLHINPWNSRICCWRLILTVSFVCFSQKKTCACFLKMPSETANVCVCSPECDPPYAPGGRGVASTLVQSSCHTHPTTSCMDRTFML